MLKKIGEVSLLEFHIRLFVVIIAALTPIILALYNPESSSLSSCWGSPIQPLFIFSNAATSYFLYGLKSWRIPAIFLMLLTAFSVDIFDITHNVFAILFFTSVLFSFYKTNHYRYLFWAYFACLLIMPINMLLSEVLSIIILCVYHGLLLFKVRKIRKEMKQIEEKL